MVPSVNTILQNYIWKGENEKLAIQLYNSPPITLDGFAERAVALKSQYADTLWHIDEKMNLLEEALVSSNRELGCFTPEVKASISSLKEGAVESAHQTVVLGGPAYILNKPITAKRIAELCAEKDVNLSTYFCVADYDIVQPELTNVRIPVFGQGGTLVSIPVPQGFEYSPVNVLPLPGHEWYTQIEEEIRSSYRPMFKTLEGPSRSLFEERLEHALSITRWSYSNSSSLGEWVKRILGRLFNVEGNLGVPLVSASHPKIRELLTEGLEFLLMQENRELFLKTVNQITTEITDAGFNPGMGGREQDYVPFYYECTNKECNSARTELHYSEQGNTAVLTGKCPSCSEPIVIETSIDSPYLGEMAANLSLRVDSRQMAIDTIIPTIVHVGGPGEAAYYSQVIPAAKAMSIPFPLFVRYPRVYFNTPWNESLARVLEEKGNTVLHRGEMFSLSGKVSRFRKKGRFDEMNDAISDLSTFILETHSKLNQEHAQLELEIEVKKGEEVELLLSHKFDLERYLSWTFGQFAEGKLGQESSWSWIEWAINSGFGNLFGPYERAYVGPMKNGATMFVNFAI
ncbi:MAG: bacillithiol biosynthesis BshC [Candidatus Thorarchaeota archaeon]|nr:MAG: bacillithiol biosynthesis BshC [Candidatus Thorarchaeota archaeon]